MSQKKKVLCVAGTRPEAIKMAPVIQELQKRDWCHVRILATAQHREMLDQVLAFFDIKPDIDLNIMKKNQSLSELTSRLVLEMDQVLKAEQPDAVLIQGDTTTVMSTALACFYNAIPVGHVEAGLRTWDITSPFPEEMNRVFTGKIADWHFAPTAVSAENLKRENVPAGKITVTGNTVIDALLKVSETPALPDIGLDLDPEKRLVLITAHRRENFGQPFKNICSALQRLALDNPDVQFLYPVHPNPNIKDVAHSCFSAIGNVFLCAPLEYLQFVAAMKRAYMIISDSGGVQEEAPALGKPVLVLREETERPEAVDAGCVKLVGSDPEKIRHEAQHLLDNPDAYDAMAKIGSPYGDGTASIKIADVLENYFT